MFRSTSPRGSEGSNGIDKGPRPSYELSLAPLELAIGLLDPFPPDLGFQVTDI